jgi:hypothetical protein
MVQMQQVRHLLVPAWFLADTKTERLNIRANTREDTLEELKRLALGKEWLTSVVVTQSVEDALKVAEHEYSISGRGSQMSCLVTGSSFLVAEALALLEASEV